MKIDHARMLLIFIEMLRRSAKHELAAGVGCVVHTERIKCEWCCWCSGRSDEISSSRTWTFFLQAQTLPRVTMLITNTFYFVFFLLLFLFFSDRNILSMSLFLLRVQPQHAILFPLFSLCSFLQALSFLPFFFFRCFDSVSLLTFASLVDISNALFLYQLQIDHVESPKTRSEG